jgi:pimeloyl-ACP methyl ester carboxylesterase
MARRYRLGLALLSRRPELARRLGDRLCREATARPELVGRVLALAGRGAGSEGITGDVLETGTRSLLAGLEAGVGAMVDDYLVACRDWGFDPEAVTAPVRIWHGALDRVAPVDASRRLAGRIPGSELRIEPGEGHFFFRRRLEPILGPLIAAKPAVAPRAAAGTPYDLAA